MPGNSRNSGMRIYYGAEVSLDDGVSVVSASGIAAANAEWQLVDEGTYSLSLPATPGGFKGYVSVTPKETGVIAAFRKISNFIGVVEMRDLAGQRINSGFDIMIFIER